MSRAVDPYGPPLEALAAALNAFGRVLQEANRQLQEFFGYLLTHREAIAEEYAVLDMGIARSDIREIVFDHPRHGTHVRLWNHRRIPLPEDIT